MSIMLFEEASETSRPASEILRTSGGFEILNDELYFVFSTIENRKGYGRQKVPVSQLDSVIAVLQNAADNGITGESEPKSCADIVKGSLTVNDDGEVRFKSEGEKGKKPTLFRDMDDFVGFVTELSSLRDKIVTKASKITS